MEKNSKNIINDVIEKSRFLPVTYRCLSARYNEDRLLVKIAPSKFHQTKALKLTLFYKPISSFYCNLI